MLAPEYGAAEEKRKKEEEAEAFAAKMNARYNNQEQEKAEDQYDHQYNRHPERTQHPDFKKHLLTPKERAATLAKKTLSKLRKAANSTSSYIRRKAAERKAYIQSPEYKALQAKKKQERAKRREAFNDRLKNTRNTSTGFSLFAPQPAARKPARPANNPMPSLFAPMPQKKSKRSKKPKNPGNMGGIIGSMPVIGGGFGGI